MKKIHILIMASMFLTGCSDKGGDGDNNNSISEKSAILAQNTEISVMPGRWVTEYKFAEIDVPTLGRKKKERIMSEMVKSLSAVSCLSKKDAKNVAADFFGGGDADDCMYQKLDVNGTDISMTISCNVEGVSRADIVLDGRIDDQMFRMNTDVDMRLPMIGKISMKGEATGRNVGPCVGTR